MRRPKWLCGHHDTYEEWAEVERIPGLILDTVTRLRTLWRCNTCGKEIRRSRSDEAPPFGRDHPVS